MELDQLLLWCNQQLNEYYSEKDLEVDIVSSMMVSMWGFLLFWLQTGVFARPFLMEMNPQTSELNSHTCPELPADI